MKLSDKLLYQQRTIIRNLKEKIMPLKNINKKPLVKSPKQILDELENYTKSVHRYNISYDNTSPYISIGEIDSNNDSISESPPNIDYKEQSDKDKLYSQNNLKRHTQIKSNKPGLRNTGTFTDSRTWSDTPPKKQRRPKEVPEFYTPEDNVFDDIDNLMDNDMNKKTMYKDYGYGFLVRTKEDLILVKLVADKMKAKTELPDNFNYRETIAFGPKSIISYSKNERKFKFFKNTIDYRISIHSMVDCFDGWNMHGILLKTIGNPFGIKAINKNKKKISIEGHLIGLELFECAVEDSYDNFITNLAYEDNIEEDFSNNDS